MNVRRHSLLFVLCSFLFAAVGSAAPTELFFSEYIEGSSNNKALEIYNPTSAAIPLTGYRVQMYFNGATTSSFGVDLAGTIPAGGTWVIAPTNANATILATVNQPAFGSSWFNGDDAVALLHSGTIIDVIGQIGVDPGTEWGTGLVSTADNTIRRKSTVCAGDPNGSNAFDPAGEWDGFAIDTFGGLGSHTASCGVVVPNNPPSINTPTDPITTVNQDAAPFAVSLTGFDDGAIYNWSATAGTGVQNVTVSSGQGTANVQFTVTITSGFNGTASFTASLSDNVNPAVTKTVNIAVNAPTVNDPPSISTPADPIITVTRDAAPFTVGLTGSDDHAIYNWSATAGTGLSNVSVTNGTTNSATFTVTLTGGFTGVATFTASLSDNVNTAATQVVHIQVNQPAVAPGTIVISQIYGGGGNTGATLKNDFIELFNRSDNPVSIDGWSVQHFSSSNPSWFSTPLTGTIQPHSYYLVQEAAGAAGTVSLPAPDAIGTIGLSSTAGTVALVRSATLLSGGICATSSDISDWVGYGSASTCAGRVTMGGLSNTVAALRVQGGCKYTPSATDWSVGPPAPRNSSSPVNNCGPVPPVPPHVVINQLYGGGGNNGATFSNDFVELYNPTDAAVSLEGWSLQYASSTGSTWGTNEQPLGGSIPSHGYFFVQLASNDTTVGALLPPPNIIGDINMSATNGKLALVKSFTALTGNCPIGDPNLVDFIGYGSADCFEGGLAAPVLANNKSAIRTDAVDTDQNSVDFTSVTPVSPRGDGVLVEVPPIIVSADPATTNAPFDATVTLNFSEPVDVAAGWYSIGCTSTGPHTDVDVHSAFGGKTWTITPNVTLAPGESCTVHVFKDLVSDTDTNDGPDTDHLPNDFTYTFTVAPLVTLPYGASVNPEDVHLKFGNPSGAVADTRISDNYLMVKPQYALSYNHSMGRPNWVSWHLTGSGPTEWFGTISRVDTFRPDPMLPVDWRIQGFDFASSGFDRGHMCPNADRDSTPATMASTFLMDNMIAQAPDNNQGPWADMENALRTEAGTANELYIVAGPAGVGGTGSNGSATTIAGDRVSVPAYTWKAALILPKPSNGDISGDISRVTASTRVIAVIMPNIQGIRSTDPNDPTKNWMRFETTVDAIEQLTGYDLFSNIPSATQNAIEASNDIKGIHPPGASTTQSASTPEDSAATFTLDVVQPVPGPLTYAIVTQPAHGSVSFANGSATYTPVHDFNGDDSFTYTVSDGTNTSTPGKVTIGVSPVNDPPVVTLTVPATSLEGSAISATVNGSDVDGDTLTYAWTVTKNGSPFANGTVVPFTFTPDDNGAYVVSVTVSDPSAATGTDTKTVTVSNVAPLITSVTGPTSWLSLGSATTLTFTYSDAGSADTHTAAVTWDDGSTSAAVCAIGVCTAPHTYASAGVYSASITLTDDDGGAASSAFSPIIITDANAGFVTGGGWVMSPAGKADFSVNAKYVKNQPAPVGSASVQVGSSSFQSTSIDWLVVRGGTAQFAGGGTINGTGNYGYQVFAADGSVDKVRIRIFDKATNATIFENAADAQALGGGNITIH